MKKIIYILLLFVITSCEKENNTPENISVSNIKFSECLIEDHNSSQLNVSNADINKGNSCLLIQAANNSYLYINHQHTMSCCGTEKIEIETEIKNDTIYVKEIDRGPFAWCYCWRNIEFEIGPLKTKKYTLHLIGCETSYNRDTISLGFEYSNKLYLNTCEN